MILNLSYSDSIFILGLKIQKIPEFNLDIGKVTDGYPLNFCSNGIMGENKKG